MYQVIITNETGLISSMSETIGMWADVKTPGINGIAIIILTKGYVTSSGRNKASLIVLFDIIAQPGLKFKGL